ncbi:cupin domain-containing protein [Falsiroseomonas bella]|uniref:Cupin domain-containing protein n=1 Tax=Falsiroseomonas bella TaxID=2184016 RepID=A0A317FJ89_9PROT|nr:cupin domain-containing protein [Falsiroseomonas bella]PWS38019.1 cupin domain-containing protein [Falsiroseomonas bella]
MSAVTLLPASAAESLYVMGDRLRFAGALPPGDVVLLEVEVPPGSGTPLHRHASPELFRVLEGEVTFATGEGSRVAVAGDVLSVASDAPHGYANPSTAPARMLVVLDRAMAAFFREIGSPAPMDGPPGPEDFARIGAACARHGITLLGGPPPGQAA